jgi:hypothetical protein
MLPPQGMNQPMPGGGIPLPPRIAAGPMPGSPIAGGPPMGERGIPLPPGMGGAPMGPLPGEAPMGPPPMTPEEERAIMEQLSAQDASMAGNMPMGDAALEGELQAGGGKKYDVEEQEDGTLVVFENTAGGGRVARKIVSLGAKAASQNV